MKNKTTFWREIIKWGILALILFLSLIHIYGNKAVWAPLDAYCPFGAPESGWKMITQGGFLEKIQPSNLALGVALIITTLAFGGIFCGWICPLGTFQDGLNRLAKWLRIPQIRLPQKLDQLFRWLRYPVLILVIVESFTLATLWFADYDPFRLILGFHWLADPQKILVGGWIVFGAFIFLALFINRFWCKYLCPLGLIVQWMGKISWFRIRWHKPECFGCDTCSKSCPMGLNVQDQKLNSTACNDCLQCVSVCPRPKALDYKAKFAHGFTLATIGVAVFGVLLVAAQFAGWWNPKIGSDPTGIKGWMTLGNISETYRIPLDEIKEEMKLPDSANAETEVRLFEDVVSGFSTELFRQYVAKRIGKNIVSNSETAKPVNSEEIKPVETSGNSEETKESSTSSLFPTLQPKEIKQEAKPSSTPVMEKQVNPDVTARDPNEIKGTITLTEVSEGWKIPLATLIKKLGLPGDVNPNVPIKEYDTPYGVGGAKVREVVKDILEK